MAGNKVVICGVNTSKLPLLSEDEKRALFARMNAGDKSAREEFIRGNLRLVLSVIQRFSGNNIESSDDLFQVGCIGLIKALDNFDQTLDVKFSTYAVPMIIGECRYMRDNNTIRVSRSRRDIAYKAIYTRDILTKKNDREPTVDEIAKELELPKEDIVTALDAIATPMSLFEPVYQEGQDVLYLMDQVKDKKNKEENWVQSLALQEAMQRLDERELNIIRLRFFEGKTQTEVADEIAISQAQVSRLEKNALKSMRHYLSNE